jgi:hypothetical protein
MSNMGKVVVLAAALAAAGCASSAKLDASSSRNLGLEREVFGDIERLQFAKQVQVRLPAKLAVADVSGEEADRRRTQTIEALSKDTSTWSDISSVFAMAGEAAYRFEDLRAAAARQQSDLMLVAQRTEDTVRSSNWMGVFKILLVPMLFLPTEELKTTVSVRAAVIDVRNGIVYTTFDSHKEREQTTSLASWKGSGREDREALFGETATEMREALARKLRTIESGTR